MVGLVIFILFHDVHQKRSISNIIIGPCDKLFILKYQTFCQDNQDGHMRRGSLHLQAQRQGQEGQVVHQEPGQIKAYSLLFTKEKHNICFLPKEAIP